MQSKVVQHAAVTVDAAVARRQGRRGHHKVDDARSGGDADVLEGQHKGAAVYADFVPGKDTHDNEKSTDIEQQNTPQHLVDGRGDGLFGVAGFTGCNADKLNAHKGEHDH